MFFLSLGTITISYTILTFHFLAFQAFLCALEEIFENRVTIKVSADMTVHPVVYFTPNHKCEPHGGTRRKVAKVKRIHPPRTMNACTKFHGIHLIVVDIFQSQPKW